MPDAALAERWVPRTSRGMTGRVGDLKTCERRGAAKTNLREEELPMAVLTEEQSMLRDAAKSWVQEKSPVTAFRKMRDSGAELGYDVNAWNEMAEMGWAGVIIPEEYGGSQFGYLSLGLILEETGRTLTASPLLASALGAASALILGGSDSQKSEWLPKIADGTAVAT